MCGGKVKLSGARIDLVAWQNDLPTDFSLAGPGSGGEPAVCMYILYIYTERGDSLEWGWGGEGGAGYGRTGWAEAGVNAQ
jgi:hypothetical protein